MHDVSQLDLARLRRSCADCSLSQLCLPAGIDRNDLGRLDTLVQKRRPLRRGDHLFRAGDGLGSVFVASEGTFKTVVINESGEEHVLGFHLPGELFGLDAVGSGRHRCEAIALEVRHGQRTEVRELAEAFGSGQKGSSAMPHLGHLSPAFPRTSGCIGQV